MTEKANPSINRPASAFKTAGSIAYGGYGDGGFIRAGGNPTALAIQDGEIDSTTLNAFAQTSNSSSLDITIDPGEAFVFGSWICIDTPTTVTLDANTNAQTIFVGWNKNGSDDVIIGTESAFDVATGNTDKKIPLFDVATDDSGVISVTDRRNIGNDVETNRGAVRRVLNSNESYTIEEDESLIVLDFFDEGTGELTVKGDFLILDN